MDTSKIAECIQNFENMLEEEGYSEIKDSEQYKDLLLMVHREFTRRIVSESLDRLQVYRLITYTGTEQWLQRTMECSNVPINGIKVLGTYRIHSIVCSIVNPGLLSRILVYDGSREWIENTLASGNVPQEGTRSDVNGRIQSSIVARIELPLKDSNETNSSD